MLKHACFACTCVLAVSKGSMVATHSRVVAWLAAMVTLAVTAVHGFEPPLAGGGESPLLLATLPPAGQLAQNMWAGTNVASLVTPASGGKRVWLAASVVATRGVELHAACDPSDPRQPWRMLTRIVPPVPPSLADTVHCVSLAAAPGVDHPQVMALVTSLGSRSPPVTPGHAWVYTPQDGADPGASLPWVLRANLTVPGPNVVTPNFGFGCAVLNGTIAIGDPSHEPSGVVHMFMASDAANFSSPWQYRQRVNSTRPAGLSNYGTLGRSVALGLGGSVLVAGSPTDPTTGPAVGNNQWGSAYIYRWGASSRTTGLTWPPKEDGWGQVARLVPFDTASAVPDELGTSVACVGSQVIVGAPYAGTADDGRVYVFQPTTQGDPSSSYSLVQTIAPGDNAVGAQINFGSHVAGDSAELRGESMLAVAAGARQPASVYVFDFVNAVANSEYTQQWRGRRGASAVASGARVAMSARLLVTGSLNVKVEAVPFVGSYVRCLVLRDCMEPG